MARARRQKRVLNVERSRKTETDWRFEHAAEAGLVAPPRAVPTAKDLREAWWGVGDQKATGSCVGWASADGVLRWHFVKANRLQRTERVSPRFMWMASKETDEFITAPTTFIEEAGTTIKTALDVARKFGVVRERMLPFESGKLYGGDLPTFYATAAQLRINAYFNLSLDKGHVLRDWRRWLATNGPILVRLDVDDNWMNATRATANLDEYLPPPPDEPRGHAVAIVGYTPDRFIVRNSWGTTWGDRGFAYASERYAQAAFDEAYGVQV
jgi:Papain family cysteine protease